MYTRQRTAGLIMILVALAIAIGAASYVTANRQPELVLDADQCPAVPASTVFALLDDTDLWPPIEQQRTTKSILAIAARMPKTARLELHVITARADDVSARRFQKCKSADPATVNPVYQNEDFEREIFEREFLGPLQSLLPDLVKGHAANQSPILEALEILLWSPHFRADLPQRVIAIHSDLLQHTTALSHLSGRLPDPCRVLASPIGVRLKGHDWRGIKLILERLRNPRDAARQTPAHLRWWAQLFYLLGVAEVFDGPTLIANTAPSCAIAKG